MMSLITIDVQVKKELNTVMGQMIVDGLLPQSKKPTYNDIIIALIKSYKNYDIITNRGGNDGPTARRDNKKV